MSPRYHRRPSHEGPTAREESPEKTRTVALHPRAQALLDQVRDLGRPPLHEMAVSDDDGPDGEAPSAGAGGGLGDRDVGRRAGRADPRRLYRPHGKRPTPALVWFRGGGFVIGGLDQADAVCRRVASESGLVVASVDDRLAPEHPFPAAADDAFAATSWLSAAARDLGIDPDRLAVGGDSAGGNLAAVFSLRARDQAGPPIAFQLLVYPVTDATMSRRPTRRTERDTSSPPTPWGGSSATTSPIPATAPTPTPPRSTPGTCRAFRRPW